MHSECPNESWAYNRSLESTPGVTSPVKDSRYKVNQKLRNNETGNNTYWILVIVRNCVVNQFGPQTNGENEKAELKHKFPCGITVLPQNLPVGFGFNIAHL